MRKTENFKFIIVGNNNKPAIWFKLNGRDILVNPCELYNTLFDCYEEKLFSQDIKARFQFFKEEVCGYFFDNAIGFYHVDFERSYFIGSAQKSLIELCDAVLQDKEVLYGKFAKDTAKYMLAWLQELVIPKNYSQIVEDEIKLERFTFELTEPYNCDTHYKIMETEFTNQTYLIGQQISMKSG